MTAMVPAHTLSSTILALFDETFTQVQGIYLDRGTSLSETLAAITAEQASTPMGREGSTIAAHVAHTIFYLDVSELYFQGRPPEKVDWGDIWRTVHAVDEKAWDDLRERLRDVADRVRSQIVAFDDWSQPDRFVEALPMIVHSAHHLGEIRQALGWIRP